MVISGFVGLLVGGMIGSLVDGYLVGLEVVEGYLVNLPFLLPPPVNTYICNKISYDEPDGHGHGQWQQ